MALITSCQASFQNVAGYEDDIAAIQENVRECYSEISKSSEQIRLSVREDYISRSEMATIQQDFQSTITQNSSEIRMDFSTITDELKDNIATNQELLEEYIRFKGALIELGKVGNAFTAELSNNELAFKENGQKIAYISNNSLVITNAEVRNKPEDGLTLSQEVTVTSLSNGEARHRKGVIHYGFQRKYYNRPERRPLCYALLDIVQSEYSKQYINYCMDPQRFWLCKWLGHVRWI